MNFSEILLTVLLIGLVGQLVIRFAFWLDHLKLKYGYIIRKPKDSSIEGK